MKSLEISFLLLFAAKVILDDLYARRVSNRLLIAALAAGLAFHFLPQIYLQAQDLGSAGAGLCLGLLALLPFYAIGWMGAGDVKLFSVIGFLFGWKALVPIWVIASLLAGVNAVVVLLSNRFSALSPIPIQVFLEEARSRWMQHKWFQRISTARNGRKGIPYAAYLGVGMIVVTFARAGDW